MSSYGAGQSAAEAADWFARMRGPDADAARNAFETWRRADPANDAAYQRLLQRWEQSAFLTNTALGRSRDLTRAAVSSRRPVARYAAIAASLLGATGIGFLALHRTASQPAVIARDYASGIGQIRHIALNDGSRLTLDADSSVKVLSENGERHVRLLRGRARFALADVRNGTFVVDAGGGTITAQPGEFDVEASPQMIRIVLWRGSLDVAHTVGGAAHHLAPGRQIAFFPSGDFSPDAPVRLGQRGWTQGMLSFDRTPLADAVAMINRYNRNRIVIASPAIGELRLTGAFHAGDPVAFARAVAAMFALELTSSPDGSIILSPGKKA